MTVLSGKRRIPLARAEEVADDLIEAIGGACERIVIAGSIRRKKPDPSDIELVCVPFISTVRTDLFGDVVEVSNDLDVLCQMYRAHGKLTDRLDKNGRPEWGSKYKRAMYQGIPVDLFSVIEPAQLGVIMAIRTGPADYTRRFVTQQNKGGLLPNDLYVESGSLWRKRWGEYPELIATPTEEAFFEAIGIQWIDPERRGAV